MSGAVPPKPSTSFAHFGFDEQLMHQIRKSEYTKPTPIQCQVLCECTLSSVWLLVLPLNSYEMCKLELFKRLTLMGCRYDFRVGKREKAKELH